MACYLRLKGQNSRQQVWKSRTQWLQTALHSCSISGFGWTNELCWLLNLHFRSLLRTTTARHLCCSVRQAQDGARKARMSEPVLLRPFFFKSVPCEFVNYNELQCRILLVQKVTLSFYNVRLLILLKSSGSFYIYDLQTQMQILTVKAQKEREELWSPSPSRTFHVKHAPRKCWLSFMTVIQNGHQICREPYLTWHCCCAEDYSMEHRTLGNGLILIYATIIPDNDVPVVTCAKHWELHERWLLIIINVIQKTMLQAIGNTNNHLISHHTDQIDSVWAIKASAQGWQQLQYKTPVSEELQKI